MNKTSLIHNVLLLVEENAEITDVVVDGSNRDRIAEISSSVGVVGFLLLFICVKRVFSAPLQIVDVSANNGFGHLIDCGDLHLFFTPPLE